MLFWVTNILFNLVVTIKMCVLCFIEFQIFCDYYHNYVMYYEHYKCNPNSLSVALLFPSEIWRSFSLKEKKITRKK